MVPSPQASHTCTRSWDHGARRLTATFSMQTRSAALKQQQDTSMWFRNFTTYFMFRFLLVLIDFVLGGYNPLQEVCRYTVCLYNMNPLDPVVSTWWRKLFNLQVVSDTHDNSYWRRVLWMSVSRADIAPNEGVFVIYWVCVDFISSTETSLEADWFLRSCEWFRVYLAFLCTEEVWELCVHACTHPT